MEPVVKEMIHQMPYEWQVQKTLVLMAMLILNIGDINYPQGNVGKNQGNLDLKPLLLVF